MTPEEQQMIINRKLAAIAYNLLMLTLRKVPAMTPEMEQYFNEDMEEIKEYYEQIEGFTPALIAANGKIHVLDANDIKQ